MPLVLSPHYIAERWADPWLFVRSWIRLAQVDMALRSRGFRGAVASCEKGREPTRNVTARDMRRAQRYARRIQNASRLHFARARCLHCSLALHGWLRQDGLPSELRIGVLKDGDALKAHAWVELGGCVLGDEAVVVSAFAPLSHPSRRLNGNWRVQWL